MEHVSIIFVFFFILSTSYSSSPFNLLFFLHWQPNNILHILQWKYLDIKLCVGLLFYVHGLYSFPFHVLVGYFASVYAPFTLFGAHNFFTLSMVFAMLRMIVYREALISTELCFCKCNFLAKTKQNNIKFTQLDIKKTKVSLFLQLIHVIISHLIHSIMCMKRKKGRNKFHVVPSHFSTIGFCPNLN